MLRVRLALRNCFIFFFFFCFLLACSFFLLRRHFDTCCVRDLLRVFASLTRPCCRQGSAHILKSCFPSDFVIPAGQCRILWLRGEVRRPREEPMEAQRDQRATKLRRDLARHWVFTQCYHVCCCVFQCCWVCESRSSGSFLHATCVFHFLLST